MSTAAPMRQGSLGAADNQYPTLIGRKARWVYRRESASAIATASWSSATMLHASHYSVVTSGSGGSHYGMGQEQSPALRYPLISHIRRSFHVEMSMFEMIGGRARLMEALRKQFLVDGSSAIAENIASVISLQLYNANELILRQGEHGDDLCLILSGKVSVLVDDREVAMVNAGLHVGEVGMLDPGGGRTATVVAIDSVVVGHIPQARFYYLAKSHPELWRRLALELAHRLVGAQYKG